MGLIKVITSSIRNYYTQKKDLSYYDSSHGWYQLGGTSYNSNQMMKEDFSSFAYASINCRAEKVRESTNLLRTKNTKGETIEVTSHPFIDLMNSKNIYKQSFGFIKYMIAVSLDLFGNAYLYVVRNKMGKPVQFIPLPSNRITPVFNSDFTQITGFMFIGIGQKIEYSVDEILHIKLPDPKNMLMGKSTISATRFQVDTDWIQNVYNYNFYKRDGSFGNVVTSDEEIDDKAFNRLNDQLTAKNSGWWNAGKWLVLEKKMKIDKITATPREAQWKDSRLNVRDEIFGIFKTSKSILGFTDDVNRANAHAMLTGFIMNCIKPFALNIQEPLDQFVKDNYDERLEFCFDYDVSKPPEEVRADHSLLASNKAITINELRQAFNYATIPDGDVLCNSNEFEKLTEQDQ